MNNYCVSRFNCVKAPVRAVKVGDVEIGGDEIVVQSMTNTKTCDVEASVRQCIQLAEAGCRIVRLTAQNLEAARTLGDISKKFRAAGFSTPLVADIHFLPATAMEAVEHVEKIRINPGNFTDRQRTGETGGYSESEYAADLERAREKFAPLVRRCKELGRAMRIGTNHGSLSDRIIRRYGDTPEGMVAAAFEFAKMCLDEGFRNFLFSFKSSNTRVMTQAYRLAASKMAAELGGNYPLHLGVTEAGFGIDARIKSSMGIGGLLFDGLGDTIRVSLTEDPVEEIPVAISLARLAEKVRAQKPAAQKPEGIDFYSYSRRECRTVDLGALRIGAKAVPAAASFGASGCADFCVENGEASLKGGGKIEIRKYGAGDSEKLLADAAKVAAIAAQVGTEDLAGLADALKRAENVVLIAPPPTGGRHAVGEAGARRVHHERVQPAQLGQLAGGVAAHHLDVHAVHLGVAAQVAHRRPGGLDGDDVGPGTGQRHGERAAVDRLDTARVGEKVGVQVVEFDRVVGVVHLGQILGFGNVLALALLFERICDLAVFFGNAAGFLCGKIAVIMLLSHSNSLLSQRFIFGSNASRRPSPTKLKPRTVSIRQMPAGIQMNQ